MKKYIISAALVLLAAANVSAASTFDWKTAWEDKKEAMRQRNNLLWSQSPKYAFGVHTGIDIGAAAPFPPSALGKGNKMSAVPKLNIALGASFTTYPINRFAFTAEATYKQVGIDAKAWVTGQKFFQDNGDGSRSQVQFRGTAHVNMSFSMLEVPLYVSYSFGDGRNRVLLGGYYSHIFQARFSTDPIKGIVVDPTLDFDPNPVLITPENPIPSDMMPHFNDYLDTWDAGMILGYQRQIMPRINLSARFSMGFKDIFRKGSNYLDYKMLHMRGTIVVSYAFLRYVK